MLIVKWPLARKVEFVTLSLKKLVVQVYLTSPLEKNICLLNQKLGY
jgi:hypothetical protein